MCPVFIHGGNLRASMPEQCEVVYAVVYNPALRSDEVVRQMHQNLELYQRHQPCRTPLRPADPADAFEPGVAPGLSGTVPAF